VLWLASAPLLNAHVVRAVEGWAKRGQAEDASAAGAIVVLSRVRVTAPGKAAISEWRDADR
jgi:hypothetical protein